MAWTRSLRSLWRHNTAEDPPRPAKRGEGPWRNKASALLLVAAFLLAGCTEVRGRKLLQEANELYKRGKYAEAVTLFEQAEALVPNLPTLWLNKGYTCRQLIAPGARDAESKRAVACALAAFKRLGEVSPKDARADQLAIQTLFDADDFATLEGIFLERNRRTPGDVDVVQGLQQVYYKWGKWPQALQWSRRAAALRAAEAEAQYGVGTFVWQVLSSKGGGAEMAAYDPRPRLPPEEIPDEQRDVKRKMKPAAAPVPVAPPPPPIAASDITGALRAQLADEGIAYLEKALALRPRYPEAMTYLGLLYRQKSFAFFAEPPKWQMAVDKANEWQKKALEARGGKS
jgi:tetratricopeptide (TPR) repeat protein